MQVWTMSFIRRISALMAQQSLGALIREEVELGEFRLGEANVDIYIYASQGEELVDHVTIDTRGSVFTSEVERCFGRHWMSI